MLAGAFLATPMTAVIRIVLEKIPATRPLAELLAGRLDAVLTRRSRIKQALAIVAKSPPIFTIRRFHRSDALAVQRKLIRNAMAASPEIIDKIKVLLRRDLKLGNDIAIPDDMPFSGTDADFDSLDILLLVTSIEKEFKIKIPSEDVGRDVFKSVASLAEYVQRESGKTGPPAEDYLARLPHRDPFRFVSRVNHLTRGENGEGVWVLTGKEPFFAGHFSERASR